MVSAVFLAVFILYSNTLHNEFVLDDETLIVKNPLIKSPKLFPLIFKTSLYEYSQEGRIRFNYDTMYRPMQLLTYALDYKIWGLNPLGYHLTNIFIHALNSILVYFLFSSVGLSAVAKVTAVLFAIHPVQTSVVAYISARADLLVSLFMLLSIIFFFKFIRLKLKRFYVFSLASAALALICRENALILFIFILLALFVNRAKPKDFLCCIPFILLNIAYVLLRLVILGIHAANSHPGFLSPALRTVNFLNILPRYISLLVLPLNLHMVRITPFIMKMSDPRVFLGAGFILVFIYLIITRRRENLLFFSLLWLFIGLLPVFFMLDGYIFFYQAMMAESWAYLSCAGFFAFCVFLIARFKESGRVVLSVFAVFYSALTLVTNTYWRNNIVVYENTLKYTSRKNPMLKNLIKSYLDNCLYLYAFTAIEEFSNYYPESSDRYLLQGDYYFATDEITSAIESYNTALKINKYNFQVYYNLSLCYQKLKQPDKALESALESIRLNPYYLNGLIMAGDLYRRKKDHAQARRYYQEAFAIDPSNENIKEKLNYAK